jgi:hypothetical protein
MRWLGAFFAAVILPLLLSEFTEWCPWLAERLVRRAATRLPEEARARWEEEWLADLNAWEGRKLSILVRGLWIFLRAPSWGRVLQGLPSFSQELRGRIKAFVRRSREQQTRPPEPTEPAPPSEPDRHPQDPQLEALRRYVSQLDTGRESAQRERERQREQEHQREQERQHERDDERERQLAALRRYMLDLDIRRESAQRDSDGSRLESEETRWSFKKVVAKMGSLLSARDEPKGNTRLAVKAPKRERSFSIPERSFSIPESAATPVTAEPFRVPPYVRYLGEQNSDSD